MNTTYGFGCGMVWNGRKAQFNGAIFPRWIIFLDESDLPITTPGFQLLFARDGGVHGVCHFVVDQSRYPVAARELSNGLRPVLMQSGVEV